MLKCYKTKKASLLKYSKTKPHSMFQLLNGSNSWQSPKAPLFAYQTTLCAFKVYSGQHFYALFNSKQNSNGPLVYDTQKMPGFIATIIHKLLKTGFRWLGSKALSNFKTI